MATLNGAFTGAVTAKAIFAGQKVPATGFPNKILGAKLELLLNGTWTDITHYMLVRDDATITFGRTNETSGMNAAQLTVTLKNSDGQFTPDNTAGAYYPYVQLNTQIRLSVQDSSVTGVSYNGYRFWGEVSEWPPQWDVTGKDVYATITASGIWRRLSQSTKTIGSPYTRYNQTLPNVAAYWPMEDGVGATSFASYVAGQSAMTITNTNGAAALASCSAFPGSDAIPQLSGAEFNGTISTTSHPGHIFFRHAMFVQSGGDSGVTAGQIVSKLHTAGTVASIEISLDGAAGGGPLRITGFNGSNAQLFTGTISASIWGIPYLVQVSLDQVSTNIQWEMRLFLPNTNTDAGTIRGTIAGTVDDATTVIFNNNSAFQGVSVGQAIVIYGDPSIATAAYALGGWYGENALDRFVRICNEEGIPVQTIGSTTTTMGAQLDDTLVNVLQTIESTDGGFIYETQNQFGLGYRTMSSLQNQSSSYTLNYNAQQVGQPLAPVTDDALVRNDITVNNQDGYSVRVYLANGPRSILAPPNGVGNGYEYSVATNSTSHSQVNALGIQLLNCGTVAEARLPNITANLARITTAPLFNAIPSTRQGDFLTISNMPSFGGLTTQKQLAWGWSETINHHTWTIIFNTIPEDPWESSFNPGSTNTGQVVGSPVTAGASNTVTGAQIAEGTIIGTNIATGGVTGGNIATGTITAVNIANATITGTQIAVGAISGTNIANATITGAQIASATITGSNVASATIAGSNIASGTITASNIASATITATQIANATITGTQIATGTITATNIANATITSSQISATAGITGSQIAGGTITASNITNATITNTQIAGNTITGSNIAGSTITAANIQNATITSTQIANGTITTTQISNTAGITGTQIAGSTITAFNTGFVAAGIGGVNVFVSAPTPFDWNFTPSSGTTTTFVASSSVVGGTTPLSVGDTFTNSAGRGGPFTVSAVSNVSGGNVTVTFTPTASSSFTSADTLKGGTPGSLWFDNTNGYKLSTWTSSGAWAAQQWGTNSIAANAITASQIASGTITAGQIASGTITSSQIAANTITAANIASGTITSTQIAANTIAVGNLSAGIVYAGIVDGTTVTGAQIVADGANGQFLIYSGTPGSGNLIGSWSGASGTDPYGNTYPSGLAVLQGSITGINIDSVTITNATLQGDILQGSSITGPAISGGSILESDIQFDSGGGSLRAYTSTTTTVTQNVAGTYTFTVPANVTSLTVECWGAGAGGNGGTTSLGGSAGGGGQYVRYDNYPVTPGQVISYTVGAGGQGAVTGGGNGTDGGDTFFDGTDGVHADCGSASGPGGNAIVGSATVRHNGGDGGGTGSTGGASGGNSGNSSAAGNSGAASSSSTGHASPSSQTGSGTGGAGGNSGANGSNGGSPGAGGGGAGKGSTSSSKTVTYSPTWSGSYYGPDAGTYGGTSNGLRSTTTMWQGGETASGGSVNGNQRCVFAFNRAQMASDFTGYTVTSCSLTLKNLHTYNSSGMTMEFDEFTGLPGSAPSTFPAADYRSADANGTIAEGTTHTYSLASSVGARFTGSTSNGLGLGFNVNTDHPFNTTYYGYFDGSATQFTITGTSGAAGSFSAGNGADGQVKITYTSGTSLVGSISPVAGTDQYSNSYVAGGSFQNLQLYGASTPSTPPSGSSIFYTNSNGSPTFITDSGYSNQVSSGAGNIQTFDANTTSMLPISANYPIPANDANVGTVYRLTVYGTGVTTTTGNASLQLVAFGTTQTSGGFNSNGSAVTFYFRLEATVAIVTTGSTGTALMNLSGTVQPTGRGTGWAISQGTGSTITVDTTAAQHMQVQASCSASWDVKGYYSTFERLGA